MFGKWHKSSMFSGTSVGKYFLIIEKNRIVWLNWLSTKHVEIQSYNYLQQFSFYFNSEQAHGMHSYEIIGYLIKKLVVRFLVVGQYSIPVGS